MRTMIFIGCCLALIFSGFTTYYEYKGVPKPYWSLDTQVITEGESLPFYAVIDKRVMTSALIQQVEEAYLQQLVFDSNYYRQRGLNEPATRMSLPHAVSDIQKHAMVRIDWDETVSFFPWQTRKEAMMARVEADYTALSSFIALVRYLKPKLKKEAYTYQNKTMYRYRIPTAIKQSDKYKKYVADIEAVLDDASNPVYAALADIDDALNQIFNTGSNKAWVEIVLFGNGSKHKSAYTELRNINQASKYFNALHRTWITSLEHVGKEV
ncbi:hypothetical protein LRP49_23355 [Enterovibrio sp. ZSDZ35]|uniref:DUF3829 domain-containing protein n=1 Tax=Enterovibrio qingdaonensis TaxID=2899818 RepID=A0ABT5QT15_9GAMM|nr:hypothetical protein [Enterovibrio sp. ZSDZ35]MDD1784116.1 hypothetical protein [Enterovibrio sp. ZSDZ35]